MTSHSTTTSFVAIGISLVALATTILNLSRHVSCITLVLGYEVFKDADVITRRRLLPVVLVGNC